MLLSLLSSNLQIIFAVILFIATYVLLLIFSKHRAYIALGSALLFIILGLTPLTEIFKVINFNVLMMILGTMGLVTLFIESKMPALLADLIMSKVSSLKWAIVVLSLFAALISAFIDNVATVLIVAPIALAVSKKLDVSPVPSLIAISLASNLQGAATLVGDTTSILLGGALDMNFLDFFWYQGRPGLFFITQVGALASTLVLLFVFRKETLPIDFSEKTEVKDYVPTILLGSMIVLLILVSLIPIPDGFINNHINGLIVMVLLIVGLVYKYFKSKSFKETINVIKELDYMTVLLLIGLFIVIGGLNSVGVIDLVGEFIHKISLNNVFLAFTIIVFGSTIFSAFIDNIPFVLTMLPVVASLSTSFGYTNNPAYVLYFGLLVGATLGGNLTPIGASANITTIGILQKEGYDVKTKDFMKYSVPFTLAAVLAGYIMTWLLFGNIPT